MVATIVFADVETDEEITVKARAREEENKKGMDGSKITGAASSYARKYALSGLFLIDDNKDADSDEYHKQNNQQKPKQKGQQEQQGNQQDQGQNQVRYIDNTQYQEINDLINDIAKIKGMPFDTLANYVLSEKLKGLQDFHRVQVGDYDVTNYYFETDIPDETLISVDGEILKEGLRRRGPSKEHRPKPIVQLGLFMDTNGIPISYKLFRGNQTDPITYLPAVEEVKKQFGIERIVVAADKAMNSSYNVSEMIHQEDGWLFSQKHRGRRGSSKELQTQILNPNDWQFNKELTFAKKSYLRERKLGTKKDSPLVKEKVLITWSKKYADRERIRREGALEYASQLTNAELFRQTSKKGGKKYLDLHYLDEKTGELKPFSPLVTIDHEQVDFDAQFDGVNVLVTSEVGMTDEEMLEAYKELAKIEDCFRVTKTELESRPVYVWTENHIQAHFLTCFIALIHLRLLQHQINWKMSPRRIANALNSAKAPYTTLKRD
ncbi:transposase [Streptococcus pneumoniae]|nr:transposase [Streptococcus pneumoniae]